VKEKYSFHQTKKIMNGEIVEFKKIKYKYKLSHSIKYKNAAMQEYLL